MHPLPSSYDPQASGTVLGLAAGALLLASAAGAALWRVRAKAQADEASRKGSFPLDDEAEFKHKQTPQWSNLEEAGPAPVTEALARYKAATAATTAAKVAAVVSAKAEAGATNAALTDRSQAQADTGGLPLPPLPAGGAPSAGFHARLSAFYARYNPGKLPGVDAMLVKFNGREAALFSSLVAKYGPEPDSLGAHAKRGGGSGETSAQRWS